MISIRPIARRRILAGLVPLLLVAGAVPLMAPTCGASGEGWKTFSRQSLIIPMDLCYQAQDGHNEGKTSTQAYAPFSCPQGKDPGSAIKAYGLVYQLIRNDVAVYWVIDPAKTARTDTDITLQYDNGFPVLKYDWSAGAPGLPPTAAHAIHYIGGPFVVDGSDYAKAMAVLRQYRSTFGQNGAVNVHVANVAFRGYAKKTMAGGWSAGGAVAPKLALLDIGSGEQNLDKSGNLTISTAKNAQPVIAGYLTEAGIGSGSSAGTASGTHGEIYDRLTLADFLPAAGSTDVHTSRLFTQGYQILWVPHWIAPGSCSNYSSDGNCRNSLYSAADIDRVLKTIAVFVSEGKDLFAECAGLGSFEGAFKSHNTGTGATSYTLGYGDGYTDPVTAAINTRFQTSPGTGGGVRYNEVDADAAAKGTQFPPPAFLGSFTSPFMQIGDYPFNPLTGAIEDYRPQDNQVYRADVTRLISGSGAFPSWDFFTYRAPGADHGNVVYLAGHSYSGVQGDFQVAGARLVLNTLFNLGSACTSSGMACDTGKLGVCGKGVIQCVGGMPSCVQTQFPTAEICDGLDNDCNGLIDELQETCYDGPGGTANVGLCHGGVRTCEQRADGSYGKTECIGEVTPAPEVCNGLDDDCNGTPDDNLFQDCYYGPSTSLGSDGRPQGICKAGKQQCTAGTWSECKVCDPSVLPANLPSLPDYATCQVLPRAEVCPSTLDENCDGQVNESSGEGCGQCTPGNTIQCYTGPAGTDGVGTCHHGSQTCSSAGSWGPCLGQQTPRAEVCTPAGGTPADENCNSQVDEGCGCITGHTQSCYTGPPGTAGVGVCRAGTQTCSAGEWGPCLGQVLPSSEICDGQDNACKGTPDLDAPCTSGFECVHGVCVSASCGVESRCRLTSGDPAGGYGCTDAGKCAVSDCGSAPCAPGQTCVGGACADPCSGVVCATGAVCASGICVGGGCYLSGCPVGQLCQQGTCSPDACDGVTCPGGTFCRQGECIQSCVFVHCASGQKCGTDGFCEQDPCAGLQCGATQKCVAGACEPDLCQGKSCGPGLVCNDGVCLDDACNGVSCAGGACVDGQCWATPNPQPIIDTPGSSSKGGCGCGSGDASPLAALLLLAALPLARRRRRAGPGLLLLVLAAGLSASACKKGDSTPAVCGGGGTLCEGTAGCVDLYTDADNCGACSSPCGDGQACSGKVCGPTSAVAPHIASFTPSVGDQGAAVPVAVDLYGERFAAGASVRVVAPSGIQTLPATLVEAGHLQVFLDLEDAAATTLFLRVLNPDNVRSNAVSFNVLTPTPSISALVPPSVVTGAAHDITVQGSGFVTASRCHFSGPSLGEQIIPTVLSGANLICTVDASGLAPSAEYKLWVANDATPTPLLSAQVSLPVASQAPTISDLSPNQAEPNDNLAVLISGDGFDVTSTVLFDGQPVVPAATFLSTKSLYVTALAVGATVRDATIAVRNGSLTSPTKPFYVRLGAPPTVSGLSPGSAYQGDTVTLSFTGGGFPANAVVQLQPPGGAFATVPGSTVNGAGTLVTASKAFTGAPLPPAGDWQARLSYPTTNGISASQIFRLLSSQAILQNASVRGAAQGVASVPVSLTVANLRPPISGVRVIFSGAAGQLTPTGSASPLGVTLSTVGLDTGTYTLQVLNPLGAAPSNSLSFNVTPGVPTLAGVAPTSAHLQDAPVLVTLTGTNFAKPDASDNGGSSVHISSAALGVTDFPIYSTNKVEGSGAGQVLPPYARVQSATQLVLHLDTRVALPGAYDVAVWNPGGLTPPQKSNTLAGAFTITQ